MPAVLQPKPQTLDCWTKFLKEPQNMSQVKNSFHTFSHSQLKQRDQSYRYTCAHGILASCPSVEVMRNVLSDLKKKSLISLLVAKDKDGDIPLQSAVRSNVNPEIIRLVLGEVSKLRNKMLTAANGKGDVPLKTAFDMRRWHFVEILLEQCVQSGLVPHLTGIGDPNITKGSSTLLHKAMKRGDIEYLKIFLNVCKKCNIPLLPVLLVPNKKNYTPWFYLLHQNIPVVQEAFQFLSEFQIDINKLYCDENGKQYIPHVAFRLHKEELKELWKSFGGRINLEDSSKQTPPERSRKILFDQAPPPPPVPLLHHLSNVVTEVINACYTRVQGGDQRVRRRRRRRRRRNPPNDAHTIARVENENMTQEDTEKDMLEEAQEEEGIQEVEDAEEKYIAPVVGEVAQDNGGVSRLDRNHSLLSKEVEPLTEEMQTPIQPLPSPRDTCTITGIINHTGGTHNNTCELLSQSSTVHAADNVYIPPNDDSGTQFPHENDKLISVIGVFGYQQVFKH